MKIVKPKYFLLPIGLSLMAASCSNDIDEPQDNLFTTFPLEIEMSLNGKAALSSPTRAERSDSADQWSIVGFNEGDQMGFFASGGNWQNGEYDTPFVNYQLTYNPSQGNGRFVGPNQSVFSPSGMNANEVYMYFPYSSTITTTGMPLRVNYDGDDDTYKGTQRCMDLLSSSFLNLTGPQGALYGEFHHAFSELIIMRGEGFDNPPPGKEDITVVTNTPIDNLVVTYDQTQDWNLALSFSYNGAQPDAASYSWQAWQGSNYGITDADKVGKKAWYVVIPTLPNNYTAIDYIQLCDNDGYYQKVSSMALMGGNTKFVENGWRYPMEITMKELVPTVNPYNIEPWGENVDLTDPRTRGINDEAEFATWVMDYNLYLAEQTPENIANLLNYGDLTVNEETGGKTWHFYILSDLDLSTYTPLQMPEDGDGDEGPDIEIDYSVIIQNLAPGDILDGVSTNLMNGKFLSHTISGLNKTFVGNLQGTLQNILFDSPRIIYSVENTSASGILANALNSGYVTNCEINNGGLFNPGGPGGVLTGTMSGGSVTNCTFDGIIYVSETVEDDNLPYSGLVGVTPEGDFNFENNDVSVIIGN